MGVLPNMSKIPVNAYKKKDDMHTLRSSLGYVLGIMLLALVTFSPQIQAQEDERYLVYDDFTLNDAMEDRLRFGPTGAFGWANGHRLVVRGLIPTSPADGKLIMHDVIVGANGKMFVEGLDPRPQLASAITQSETAKMGGKLTLRLIRDGKPMSVNIQLQVLGTYAKTWSGTRTKPPKNLSGSS